MSELRASDADREATAERLHAAALEGRLDAEELESRLTAAYGARWCSELERLTADVTPVAAVAPLPPARPVFTPGPRTNGYAITSIVAGAIWALWLGSLVAIVFGHLALRDIKRSPQPQGGRGLAIAGLCLGYFAFGLLALGLMFGEVE